MDVYYSVDEDNLTLEAAEYFFSEIRSLLKQKDAITVALDYHSSLYSFYSNLSLLSSFLEKEAWKKIIFVIAHERVVPLDYHESSYHNLNHCFFSPLLHNKYIGEKQIILINPEEEDPSQAFNKKVSSIDLAVLCVCPPKGTLVGLAPRHPALQDEIKTFLLVKNFPSDSKRHITLSPKQLISLETTFLFFTAKETKQHYKDFLDKTLSSDECPAKLVENNKNLYVFTVHPRN
ncbi:MAG: 6-phosphogluconolactonase [Nanoarchaeota archaeon]|nr:6-phosphogluconolactonase [Nanoarchaeota archaeon]